MNIYIVSLPLVQAHVCTHTHIYTHTYTHTKMVHFDLTIYNPLVTMDVFLSLKKIFHASAEIGCIP